MGKKLFALVAVLLVASIAANIYFVSNPTQLNLSELKSQINSLEETNAYLSKELYKTNLSLQQAKAQLDLYRGQIAELETQVNRSFVAGEEGRAQLDAPAVMQRVEYEGDYPFYTRRIVEEGTMMQVSVDIKQGYGRVLVKTKPLMALSSRTQQIPQLSLPRITQDVSSQKAMLSSALKHPQKSLKLMDRALVP
jgi:septal ring factor EnvC (AmiA/AmiB activator)